jgi:hypothetical protein
MARPLDSTELRRYSLPWNCRHLEQWSRRRATEGDAAAGRKLVHLLLSRHTNDSLSEAEQWCQEFADQNVDMRSELGAIAVRREAYDQAVTFWRQAAHDGDVTAGQSLALVEAARGNIDEAIAILRAGGLASLQYATTYAAMRSGTASEIQVRRVRAAAQSGDANAINFLGLASFMEDDINTARDYWIRAFDLGDWTAPLLLARLRGQ